MTKEERQERIWQLLEPFKSDYEKLAVTLKYADDGTDRFTIHRELWAKLPETVRERLKPLL